MALDWQACIAALRAANSRVEISDYTGAWYGHGLGGPTRVVVTAKSAAELSSAAKIAASYYIPYRVVGSGSSILVSDAGYEGLLIRNQATAVTLDRQRSIATVESGVRIRQLVMQAAAVELGGLIHRYVSEPGTIAGSLVRGHHFPRPEITELIKSVTVYVPASKRRPEGAILTMSGDWLRQNDAPRLQPTTHPLPVLLSMQVQLTALRPDELQRRMQPHVRTVAQTQPGESVRCIGPIFTPSEAIVLRDVLQGASLLGYRVGGAVLSATWINYIEVSNDTSVRHVQQLITAIVARVAAMYGVTLVPMLQIIGEYPQGYMTDHHAFF